MDKKAKFVNVGNIDVKFEELAHKKWKGFSKAAEVYLAAERRRHAPRSPWLLVKF